MPLPQSDAYVSDPAKPVPYIPRPVRFADSDRWKAMAGSAINAPSPIGPTCSPIKRRRSPTPVRISGAPVADLFAATSGTDTDWVVKLIDVYPDEVPSQPEHGRL